MKFSNVPTIAPLLLIAEARKLVGSPFMHQGRSEQGMDCSGLLVTASRNAGIDVVELMDLKEYTTYGKTPTPVLYEMLKKSCKPASKLEPAVVLLFKMPMGKYPYHFAIYTERNTIIHAEAIRSRKVVEHIFGAPWPKRVHSMWLIPGVVY